MIWHANHEIAKQAMGGLQRHPTQFMATLYGHAHEDAVAG
jgi:hypothetical protein